MGKTREYEIKRAQIINFNGDIEKIWVITKNKIPYIEANQFLQSYCNSTANEYGKKLTVFLNYFNDVNINYKNASRKDIIRFLNYVENGKKLNGDLLVLYNTVSTSTIGKYITVIKLFYKKTVYLMDDTEILLKKKEVKYKDRYFKYGQIYNYNYD